MFYLFICLVITHIIIIYVSPRSQTKTSNSCTHFSTVCYYYKVPRLEGLDLPMPKGSNTLTK